MRYPEEAEAYAEYEADQAYGEEQAAKESEGAAALADTEVDGMTAQPDRELLLAEKWWAPCGCCPCPKDAPKHLHQCKNDCGGTGKVYSLRKPCRE